MLTFDSTTRATLSGATTKKQWAELFVAAFGNTRRLRAFRDANAQAADPFATGVEFRNVGSTGAMTVAAGKVTKLGSIKGTTIQLAAEIVSGKSILRIEGAGRWCQGSLGLSKAAQLARGVLEADVVQYDFTVRGNFTNKNGLSIAPNFSVAGYKMLPSGTGPASPTLDANAPHIFEVWDWTNPAAPIMAGSTTIANRDVDFVFEDAARAAEVGDVGVYQTATGIMMGDHEFGFTLLASHAGNAETGDKPLYQVIGAGAHRGSWTGYPQSTSFNQQEHVMIPRPFKVVVKNAANSILGIIEWSNGRAINATKPLTWTTQGQTCWPSDRPLEPNWNIGMQLYWENALPKMSAKVKETYAGISAESRRVSRAKTHFTVNGVEPLVTGGYQGNSANGIHNIYYVTQWPNPNKTHITPPDPQDPSNVVVDQFNRGGASSEYSPWSDGWDYQPGSYTTHNWYTGPGGPRFDRGWFPSTLALWISDPNGTRAQGSVPWKSMGHAFAKAYFNHSNHQVTNPNTLMLATDNNDLFKNWTWGGTYYDGHYNASRPKQIPLQGSMSGGESQDNIDKNGQYFWSGWGRDTLHAYGHAGFAAITINSPAHAIASKWDTFMEETASVKDDYGSGAGGTFYPAYMIRTQAWRWLNYVLAWKNASTHRLGVSRAEIEDMFARHLEVVYSSWVKPSLVDNSMEEHYRTVRDLGTPTHNGQTSGGALGYYMTGVLVMMKQTGLWAKMMGKGGNVRAALLAQIRNMNKYAAGMLLDTNCGEWSGGGYQFGLTGVTNWYAAPGGKGSAEAAPLVQGLWTNADGTPCNDRDVSVHMIAAHPYAMRDYFPELTHERNAELIARLDQEYANVTNYVNAATTDKDKMLRDHIFGYPAISRIEPPTVLGPTAA